MRIREWDNGERVGTTVEIEADSIGHDLMWGTAHFTRSIVSSAATVDVATDAAVVTGEEHPAMDEAVEAAPQREPEPATPF